MTLELQNLSQKFSQKTALNNICVTFSGGKIHALVGENGAGKSTLASILCGDREPTSGTILIDGKPVTFKTPRQASDNGIILIHQRPLLAQSISAQENILLGTEHCLDSYDSPAAKKLPKRFILARLSLYAKQWAPELKLNSLVKDLGGDERFYTSLLGALCRNPKFLILDEPSVFLNEKQRQNLYKNLRTLAQKGTTILVITHSMAEASFNTDTVTALAKGSLIAHYEDSSLFQKGCKGFIEFKSLDSVSFNAFTKAKIQASERFISFSDVTVRPVNRPALFNISFTAKSSQITLIQGLAECGLGTLEDLISGMIQSRCSGRMTLSCHEGVFQNTAFTLDLSRRKLTAALLRGKTKKAVAIIPSDRTYRASNPELTVEQILCVYYTGKNPREYAQNLIEKADVAIKSAEKASKLSGGMLQRLILAREIDVNPQILILCEPLQGLDSAAASDMCKKLSNLAARGKAILVLSTLDFPAFICSNVYTLSDGKLIHSKTESGDEK